MDPLTKFFPEMHKIAVSKSQLSGSQSRAGRRPMSVDTLLRKEKDGSLFRKMADAIGVEISNGKKRYLHGHDAEKALQGIGEGVEDASDPLFGELRHMFDSGTLEGGLAEREGKKPSDFDPYELAKGTESEEEEHTNDLATARQIAMDHLTEHPLYYEALPKMEEKLTEEEKALSEKKAWAKLTFPFDKGPSSTGLHKIADSWKPQWLELNSAPNDYFMQPTPQILGKIAPGDVPSLDEGITEGQKAPATYAQPTNNALPPKEAAIGRLVRSPTDTVPDVDGPLKGLRDDRNYEIKSTTDPQPFTGTSSDAYQRT